MHARDLPGDARHGSAHGARRRRRRARWLILGVALVASGCDWSQSGYDAAHTNFNPAETAIGPANVSRLTVAWTSGSDSGSTRAAPAVVSGNVFLGGADGRLRVFPVACGTQGAVCHPTWQGVVNGNTTMQSPAVVGGNVIATGSASPGLTNMMGFSASGTGAGCTAGTPTTCAAVFAVSTGGLASATAGQVITPPTISGGSVFVAFGPAFVPDAGTVAMILRFPPSGVTGSGFALAAVGAAVQPSDLAVSGELLFVKFSDNTVAAFATAFSDSLTEPVWSAREPFAGTSGPAVAGGVVYSPGGDGTLYAYSATTGTLLWKGTVSSAGAVSSPAIANGFVYVAQTAGANGGHVRLVAFPVGGCGQQGATCSPVWSGVTGGTHTAGAPTVANGVVYIGTSDVPGELDAFAAAGCGAAMCNPLLRFSLPSGGVTTSATIANGAVYFGTSASSAGLYKLTLPGGAVATSARVTRLHGFGPRALGTLMAAQSRQVHWRIDRSPARLSYRLGASADVRVITLRGRTGTAQLPPGSYRDVSVIARGKWSLSVR